MSDEVGFPVGRRLHSGPLRYEPRNEQGVVALFGAICEDEFGLEIEDIGTEFPDCLARRQRGGRRVRIEFEFESSRFDHPEWWECDWVVCWVDNANRAEEWRRGTGSRKGLPVKELRPLFPELGAGVWIQPYQPENVDRLRERTIHREWTVPSEAAKGDLLLVYQSQHDQGITHVMEVTTPAEYDPEMNWGTNYKSNLRTVLELRNPVTIESLQSDRRLRSAPYIKRPGQLGTSVLPYWPPIEDLIATANRGLGVRKKLKRFNPRPAEALIRP